ncbi:hypothetical protein G6514_009355 [Epicoccum nigrum]|nr:hypothetical protein G6514_009355 [Epicoccum nigrum]
MQSKNYQSKPWELAPLVTAFRPRIRYVRENSTDELIGDCSLEFDSYLPESLIVLIDDFVLAGQTLAPGVWTTADTHVSTWYDELRSLLNLKTFNIQFPDTQSYFTPTFKAALQVGKMLLEEKSVKNVNLLFREKVQASAWQKIVEDFFGPVLDTKDVETTSQDENKSLVRQFDALEAQPWAFENDMPWFSDRKSMEQVIRITRCKDTQPKSSTHNRRT